MAIVLATHAFGQKIELKTGQVVETGGVRRSGDTIMGKITVGVSAGEIGYPIVAIARIDFPEPQALETARRLLFEGQPEKAIAQLDPILKYYEPYKTISGAWWTAAALVKSSALAGLHREDEAGRLSQEIRNVSADPEITRAADLQLAHAYIRNQQWNKAAQICDDALKSSTDERVLAEAWTCKGDLLAAQKQWEPALLAYLHVSVFFSNEAIFLPGAMLGSGRAYQHLHDNEHARRAFDELIASFPKAAEASAAQQELRKLPK